MYVSPDEFRRLSTLCDDFTITGMALLDMAEQADDTGAKALVERAQDAWGARKRLLDVLDGIACRATGRGLYARMEAAA